MRLTTRRLAVAVLFVGLFAMATRVAVDTDAWWHLATGRWIVEHGRILTEDVFTHTFSGQPYYYPAWITEVLMYLLFRALGPAGLSLFTSAFVVLAFAFVYHSCEGGPYLRAFCLVLAATASAVYWAARPHIVSFALAGIYVYVLHLWRWRGVNRLWALPPLMILWANSHPGFAIGFILLILTLAGETLSALAQTLGRAGPSLGSTGWRGVGWLAGTGLACAVAVAVNPVGLRLLLYPFQTVSIGVLQDFIAEWQSPNFHFREQQVFIWLLLATLAAIGFSGRRLNVTDFLLLGGTAYLALLAGRNIALFAIVAAPVLTRHVDSLVREMRLKLPGLKMPGESPTSRRAVRLNWVLLALVVAAALVKVALPLQPALYEREAAKALPVAAARYLLENEPGGPMFNSYNWGGFLLWTLYGKYPVYVDGRTDLYPNQFLLDYLDVVYGRPRWRGILDRDGIRLIVIESNSVLAEFLKAEAGWRLVYDDQQAAIFTREGS